ncbi:MAG: hypothetical protein AB1578_22180 [Thermodesulfobacteriota bacterium]
MATEREPVTGRRWVWGAVALLVLAADYATGPRIHFPILYVLPVALAARGGSRTAGLLLAAAMPLARLAFLGPWGVPWRAGEEAANAAVTFLVLGGFAYLAHANALQTRALRREVKVLRGLLPICSFCKKIRDGEGAWQPLERFIGERSEAEFTHGVCPECIEEHYGQHLRSGRARDPKGRAQDP